VKARVVIFSVAL